MAKVFYLMSLPNKSCSICKKSFSVENFYLHRGKPRAACKVCHHTGAVLKNIQKGSYRRSFCILPGFGYCNKCKSFKSEKDFFVRRDSDKQFRSLCKSCCAQSGKLSMRKWAAKDRLSVKGSIRRKMSSIILKSLQSGKGGRSIKQFLPYSLDDLILV